MSRSTSHKNSDLNFFIIFVIILLELWHFNYAKSENNLSRQKRAVYFPYGGTFKIIVGIAEPVQLGLRQSMSVSWNFQFQYALPQFTNNTQVYPPIISRKKRNRVVSERAGFYRGIEEFLNRQNINGRACLLRSICENAVESTYHEANGLYGHLLHIFLTPDYGDGLIEDDLDPIYLDAEEAGKFGVDCMKLYSDCPYGNGLLDKISLLDI